MKKGIFKNIIEKMCFVVTTGNKQLLILAINSILNLIFGMFMIVFLFDFFQSHAGYMPFYYNSFPCFTILCAILVPLLVNSMHKKKKNIMRERALSSSPTSAKYRNMQKKLMVQKSDQEMKAFESEFGDEINTL